MARLVLTALEVREDRAVVQGQEVVAAPSLPTPFPVLTLVAEVQAAILVLQEAPTQETHSAAAARESLLWTLQLLCSPNSLPQQMQAQRTMLAPGPMLPEIDGLPSAEQQSPIAKRQGEGGAGQGRADVGGHVIGALVVVAIGSQITPATDRSHPLLGHQGLEVGGQIHQNPGVGVLVDRERAGGVQAGQVGQAIGQPAGPDLTIKGGGDVGEAFATGVEAELLQA